MNEQHSTVSTGTAFMMGFIAVIIDGVQALLNFLLIGVIINPFINIVAAMMYGIWFSHHNMSVMSTKTAMPFFATILGEFVPLINTLPMWSGFIVFAMVTRKIRDVI